MLWRTYARIETRCSFSVAGLNRTYVELRSFVADAIKDLRSHW